uniref:Uncharacterized protein n=1 Tax=Arundo donax TaxID=35708 RepID=A0A0A8YHJ5_ARUDO
MVHCLQSNVNEQLHGQSLSTLPRVFGTSSSTIHMLNALHH